MSESHLAGAQPETQTWFADALSAILARRELTETQVRAALNTMMHGQCGDAEAAALLIGWRMKGETATEIAAAARVLREHMIAWDPGPAPVLDTCGTGGDGAGAFNISTATAFVVAAAGVPVVKHGNRAVSSNSGSADALAALGIKPEGDAASARRALERCGLAFCFAPNFHPALKHVAPLRRRLGVGTLFNWLGPLANPAGAAYQLLGVGRMDMLDRVAGALANLGTRQAFVICSRDGLDEVSLGAPVAVRRVRGNSVEALEWTTNDFGLAPCTLEEIRANGPQASAAMIRAVLQNQACAATRIVTANAAAALLAAERVSTLPEGVAVASEAIQSGKALQVLETLVQVG